MAFLPDSPRRLEVVVDAPTRLFALPSRANPDSLRVSVNGLVQPPWSYELAGNGTLVDIGITALRGDTVRADWQEAS